MYESHKSTEHRKRDEGYKGARAKAIRLLRENYEKVKEQYLFIYHFSLLRSQMSHDAAIDDKINLKLLEGMGYVLLKANAEKGC